MGDVKPWEPVTYHWQYEDEGFERIKDCWKWELSEWESFSDPTEAKRLFASDQISVTLANGQRIIVRALSEERKAARRARREGK